MNYETNGGVWKVYASKDYDPKTPRLTNKVSVNLPDYMPTVPQDDQYTNVAITSGYFVNDNYPNSAGSVKSVHCMELPLLRGTSCPVMFPKGTEFLLYTPTGKIEEGYLIYIDTAEDDA